MIVDSFYIYIPKHRYPEVNITAFKRLTYRLLDMSTMKTVCTPQTCAACSVRSKRRACCSTAELHFFPQGCKHQSQQWQCVDWAIRFAALSEEETSSPSSSSIAIFRGLVCGACVALSIATASPAFAKPNVSISIFGLARDWSNTCPTISCFGSTFLPL